MFLILEFTISPVGKKIVHFSRVTFFISCDALLAPYIIFRRIITLIITLRYESNWDARQFTVYPYHKAASSSIQQTRELRSFLPAL